jgi:hypothetical protein
MWMCGAELGGLVENVGRMWMLCEREWEFYSMKGRWTTLGCLMSRYGIGRA